MNNHGSLGSTNAKGGKEAEEARAAQEDRGGFCSDTAALAFLHLLGNGNPNVERAVERLRSSLTTLAQQPAAVPALEVFRIAGGDTECDPNPTPERALEVLHDLRACYDEALAQQPAAEERGAYYVCPVCHGPGRVTRETHDRYRQPAAVDKAYPAPRNRAEAVALAKLALAYLGVIDAHIDAAIARCETSVAQPGGDPRPFGALTDLYSEREHATQESKS